MKRSASREHGGALLAVTLAALTGWLGCGSGGGGGAGNGDPELFGTWAGTEVGGGSTDWTFTFTTTTMRVMTSGVEAYVGTYTADPLSDPKRITAKITECSYTPYVGQTTNAIYQIEGTTLTFAGNEPGNSAVPTSFTPVGNTRVFVATKQ